ncbi:ComEC/Rec2 family competence protein [Thermosulfurimonas marina]|uniref:ComEC/Rec2 family competence protein n=1 Tax=Thermosulfurimonas marina TaxID=2047767 RepID=UPI00144AE83B|nr:ComEC/Rec2 family competence protein [Thermosulfurimonas marina]
MCAWEGPFSAPGRPRPKSPPLLLATPALALGLLLSFWETSPFLKALLLGTSLLLRRPTVPLALLLGLLLGSWHLQKDRNLFLKTPQVFSGKILEEKASFGGTLLEVQTRKGRGQILARRIPPECRAGADFVARLWPGPRGFLNPFSPTLSESLLAQGLRFRLRLKNSRDLECFPRKSRGISALRARLYGFALGLSPEARGLFSALILGEKVFLEEDFRERITRLGLFHFLAVSGFHLGLLYGLIFWATRNLLSRLWSFSGIPVQIPAALAGLFSAIFYAALAGFPPSAERALAMLGLFTLSRIFFRRVSGWELLAGAVVLLLFLKPQEVLSVSFRLSVAAVAGILLAHGLLKGRLPQRRLLAWPLEALALSLGAWAFTLPLVLYYFGEAALLGPLNTLLTFPLWCAILIPGELLCGLLALISPGTATPMAETLGHLAGIFRNLPLPSPVLRPPWPVGLFSLALASLLASLVLFFYQRRSAALFSCGLFLLLSALGWGARERVFYLLVSDIGKANAVAVHLPGNQGVLFDAGARFGNFEAGRYVLRPLLKKLGFPDPKLVLLSHPDLDHTGGLPALKEDYPLRKVLSGAFRPSSWRPLGEIPEALKKPMVLSLERAQIFLLPGRPAPPARLENRESLLSFLEYRGLTVFFPGDADRERLLRLLREGALLPSEVFILPHHGAASGLFAPAWEALKPRVALASARGRKHPHPAVRRWLKVHGIPLYETAREGALTLFVRGDQFLLCPEKRLRKGLPKELLWPYIPYVVSGEYCEAYELHTLRDL